jgi:hypothetical protein
MKNKYSWDMLRAALLILAATFAVPTFAAGGSTTDMDVLREKVRADKKYIVSKNMELSEEEAKVFWPIYEDYQKDLHKINDRMAKLINEYADAYNKGALTDKTAKKLTDEALEIETSEVKLKQRYMSKLIDSMSWVKAARYLQIENKIRAIVRYELAQAIPLAQ